MHTIANKQLQIKKNVSYYQQPFTKAILQKKAKSDTRIQDWNHSQKATKILLEQIFAAGWEAIIGKSLKVFLTKGN